MSKKRPTTYIRKVALSRVTEIVNRYFVPTATAMPAEVADVVEFALKTNLPGFHVRVSIERIRAGERE